jgi:predicted Zn-dependent protease
MKMRLMAGLAVFAVIAYAPSAPLSAKKKRAPEPASTAPMAPQSISAKDKATGAKAHPELLAEFGGIYPGSQANYVTKVGRKIAVESGLSNSEQDFTISLLNSPVNNAFAIPGGYVYVTRQLLTLMNDEAELASVLGHETGHVAAQHSKKRNSAATRNGVIGVLGQVLSGVLLGNSGLGKMIGEGIGQGAQMLTLKFSRTQEFEADDLGVTYLAKAGYDPSASSTMLASLAAQEVLDAQIAGRSGGSVPAWASTHPEPGARVARALQKAQMTGSTNKTRNRDVFLSAINGTMYGDDPKQGIIDGQTFSHPELKLTFSAPSGFGMSNGTQAVTIAGSGGQAQFSGGPYNGDLRSYIDSVFKAVGGQNAALNYGNISTTNINGLKAGMATATASTQSGQVDVTVTAYEFGSSSAFHFVTVTPAGSGLGPFSSLIQSMRRLSAQDAAAIKPRRLEVVTVRSGDTIASLAGRMAYSNYRTERFQTLNRLSAGQALSNGQKVKVVVY